MQLSAKVSQSVSCPIPNRVFSIYEPCATAREYRCRPVADRRSWARAPYVSSPSISPCVRGLISSARNLQETAFPPSVRQVYEGMDPMEEANRLRREGALDFLQYRWVGAVLCRGAGRLERPVVWSTFVRIADGPK